MFQGQLNSGLLIIEAKDKLVASVLECFSPSVSIGINLFLTFNRLAVI